MSGNLTEKRTVERAARPLERAEHTRGRNGATGEKRGDNYFVEIFHYGSG